MESRMLALRNESSVTDDERIMATADALASAVDLKAGYRPSHCRAVMTTAAAIAAAIGVNGQELARLRLAGLLHDVGKLHVPDAILNKPGPLTATEREEIEQHPLYSHRMLVALGLSDEARWVLHHHERGDGCGYPTGLPGEAIPLASRILAIADTWDCMTTTRVYRRAMSPTDALTELRTCTGQFDGAIVERFAHLVLHHPAVHAAA